MAAVLPFLETEQFHFPPELAEEGGSLSGLGAKVKQTRVELIAASNSELTRTLWVRAAVQQALKGRSFQLVRVNDTIHMKVLGDDLEKQITPWAALSVVPKNGYELFSTNSKMRCPTFDLPAGAANTGGACPAAGPAQTTSLMGREPTSFAGGDGILIRRSDGTFGLRVTPNVDYELSKSVCSYCYAAGSGYAYTSTQLAEIVRYSVAQAAASDSRVGDAFVAAAVWQIPLLPYRSHTGKGKNETGPATSARMERLYRLPDGTPKKVIRVHSSGDFFNMEYAKLWLRITREIYDRYGDEYVFWAPTRTQVLPRWARWWTEQSIPPNFVIRPSAYGIGDYAPGSPNLAKGTSVLTPDDSLESKGIKFDHQCGVYAAKKDKTGNNTCVDAMSPPGKNGEAPQRGCRACWVRPELRINYVAH